MFENHNIEFKAKWKDEYMKTIAAFSNTDGGILHIGRDDNGRVIGVSNIHKLLKEIPDKIRDYLGVMALVKEKNENGIRYIEIEVPISLNAVSYRGVFYWRSGSTTMRVEGDNLNQLLLSKNETSWDNITVDGIDISDFRSDAFLIFKERAIEYGRMNEKDFGNDNRKLLQKLKLLKNSKLTRAAVLLFYQEPEEIIDGAYVKIAKFIDESEIEYMDEVHGSLLEQAEKVEELLFQKYFKAKISYNGLIRVETYPYPKVAVREAIYNSIAHKAYTINNPIQIKVFDDKLLISNNCILPVGWTVETLISSHTSEPHNPKIAQVFYRAGMVESWGRGITRIIRECEEHGISQPKFKRIGKTISIEFRSASQTKDICINMDDLSISIFKLIKNNGSITIAQISKQTGYSKSTIQERIKKMKDMKVIVREGKRNKGVWKILET